jgi:tetratricopeptide (TPR) repeat protein
MRLWLFRHGFFGMSVSACLFRRAGAAMSVLPCPRSAVENWTARSFRRGRFFAAAACYRCAVMGGKPATSRPSVMAQLVLLPVVLLALAGCATPGTPGASEGDKPLYPGPQSNVASLSEVIGAHPDDPQAYNMRGSVYGEAGRPEQALADFNKAISLDPN